MAGARITWCRCLTSSGSNVWPTRDNWSHPVRKRDIEEVLSRRPFVPLTIHLDNGQTVGVPFSHVAVPLERTLIVFQGVKAEGSRLATGKTEFAFDRVTRIEPSKSRGGQRRRKAS